MQIPRFSCKIFLHLIPEPEEKASELLRDLNANDISCRNPAPCRTSEFSHAPGHRRHHPSRRCPACRCCPTSCSCHACRYCSPCYATAHSLNADPTAAASSHPAATGTTDATIADRYPADGAHVYAHARRRTDTRRTLRTERQCCRRPARREKSQHRQGRSQARKGAGIPCHPQHHRHRQTRQMGR